MIEAAFKRLKLPVIELGPRLIVCFISFNVSFFSILVVFDTGIFTKFIAFFYSDIYECVICSSPENYKVLYNSTIGFFFYFFITFLSDPFRPKVCYFVFPIVCACAVMWLLSQLFKCIYSVN